MEELKWPSRLVIVRHGQSELNRALDLYDDGFDETLRKLTDVRDADIELTELGVWQAEKTGELLAGEGRFDICFSSPYRRTVQTAEAIISRLPYGLKIYKDNRLREKEFGNLHGISFKQIKERNPELDRARRRDGKYQFRAPGGENYPDTEDRVHSFLDKMTRDYRGQKVLVATHHVPYVSFRTLFEHLEEETVIGFDVPNCGIQEYMPDVSRKPEGRMVLQRFSVLAYDNADFIKQAAQ